MSGRFRLKAREWLGAPERKRVFNELHFAVAAPRYDIATRAMSLGRDAAWKRSLVGALPDLPAPRCLDLACGTGDIAVLLARKYPHGSVTGVDLSLPMLTIARARVRSMRLRFERADLCDLPAGDASFDIVTGSSALRNSPDLRKTVGEIGRVLSPGGVAAFLDFSHPDKRIRRHAQYKVLRIWCGFWGLLLHGTPEVHGYIAESLRDFPGRERLLRIFREEGFSIFVERRFLLGVTALMVFRKDFPSIAADV